MESLFPFFLVAQPPLDGAERRVEPQVATQPLDFFFWLYPHDDHNAKEPKPLTAKNSPCQPWTRIYARFLVFDDCLLFARWNAACSVYAYTNRRYLTSSPAVDSDLQVRRLS